MFSSVVMNVPREKFDEVLEHKKQEVGAATDTDLSAQALNELVAAYHGVVQRETGRAFPEDPFDQTRHGGAGGLCVVVRGPGGGVSQDLRYSGFVGVRRSNVVAMVFGNMGETSGTGVMFSRNPSTGEREIFGECLLNAQGEDVVAGLRTPLPVSRAEGHFARRLSLPHDHPKDSGEALLRHAGHGVHHSGR